MASKSILSGKLRSLVDAAGAAIDSIKLNGISNAHYRGRPLRIKRRRIGSEHIAGLANLFFPLADARIEVYADLKKWQRWEVSCFQMLNGDKYRAFACGPRSVCAEKLPGTNLRQLAKAGKLTPRVLQAAAREIRRAHRFHSKMFRGPWSHGDLHMGNVIYDPATDRARLIDFEIIHDRKMPALARHADDLLVFLQEMVSFVSAGKWLPSAMCFLKAYGRTRVILKLRSLLVVPDGLPGMWWTIRCNYYDSAKVLRRMTALRQAIDVRFDHARRTRTVRGR